MLYLAKIFIFKGRCDFVIVPRDIEDYAYGSQLRIMIEVKSTKEFDSCFAQILAELVLGNYNSLHPFLLLQTDFVDKFELWQIKSNKILKCTTSSENAFGLMDYWLRNVCSTYAGFDWKEKTEHEMDSKLLAPLEFLHEKYKVRIAEEFHERIREQLEVIREADSDLSPFEQFLNIEDFFLTIIN